MNPTEYRELVYATADRIQKALEKAPEAGRTAWELRMDLKLPSPLLHMALGVLLREGQIDMAPHELTYRVKTAARPAAADAATQHTHSQPREEAAAS